MLNERSYQAVLFDIEGTTTSIAFVKDILFPYALSNVSNFLKSSLEKKINLDVIDELIQLSADEFKDNLSKTMLIKTETEKWVDDLINNVQNWIKDDKKFTALKKMQGIMWRDAYLNGEIKGHVYADVPKAFERLMYDDISIFIFSSGSIQAQKLLFAHSIFGDLTKYINGYFDTTIGSKLETDSYKKIIEKIGFPANEVLFVTDIEKEAIAARKANLQVILSIREGNNKSEEVKTKFNKIHNFDEL